MLKTILFLSLAAFATGCASQASEATSGDESDFTGSSGAVYTLSASHSQSLNGAAKVGSSIEIDYALERLPQCRGNSSGGPGWNITGFYSENGGDAKSFDVTKLSPDGKDRVSAPAKITPTQGGDLALWFQVTSVFGCSEYDSSLGANYHINVDGPAPGTATATITFDKSGAPSVDGELKAGGKAIVHYEQDRLTKCEAYSGGYPQYGIGGYASINGGTAKGFDTGRAENGERVTVDATIDLPSSGDLALYFDTTSTYGCHDYDSNNGANYHFTIE